MSIAEQHYAFFKYTDELASKCIEHLIGEHFWGDHPSEPDIIRVKLLDLRYTFARTANKATQRPVLEPWILDSLMVIPTFEARVLFVTELYDEQHTSRENESNGRSKNVLKRPWL